MGAFDCVGCRLQVGLHSAGSRASCRPQSDLDSWGTLRGIRFWLCESGLMTSAAARTSCAPARLAAPWDEGRPSGRESTRDPAGSDPRLPAGPSVVGASAMVGGGETLNVAFRSAEGQPRTPGWAWRHCPGSYCRGVGAGAWRPRLMVPRCASVGGPQRRFPQQVHLEQLLLNNQGVDCSLGVSVSTPHRHQRGVK